MRKPPMPISVHTEETTMTVGYDQPLYVLPFDGRGTFQKNIRLDGRAHCRGVVTV
jgi:hypothetical protein